MIEGHRKQQVDAWLEEAVSSSEVSYFTFTAGDKRTDRTTDSLRTSTLVDTDTQVDRVALRRLLTPAYNIHQCSHTLVLLRLL